MSVNINIEEVTIDVSVSDKNLIRLRIGQSVSEWAELTMDVPSTRNLVARLNLAIQRADLQSPTEEVKP